MYFTNQIHTHVYKYSNPFLQLNINIKVTSIQR